MDNRYDDARIRPHLEACREWVKQRIAEGSDPPWAWYRIMQLDEAATAILKGMKAKTRVAHLTVATDNTDGIEVDLPI